MQFIDNIPIWALPDPGAVSQSNLPSPPTKSRSMADITKLCRSSAAWSPTRTPSALRVGYDIACGNKAVRVDMPLRARAVFSASCEVWRPSASASAQNNERVNTALRKPGGSAAASRSRRWLASSLVRRLRQFITWTFSPRADRVWTAFTSAARPRHKLAMVPRKAAQRWNGRRALCDSARRSRRHNIVCMNLAGEYAYAAAIGSVSVSQEFGAEFRRSSQPHNFAWRDRTAARLLGRPQSATPAFPAKKFRRRTMGETSVISRVENEAAKHSPTAPCTAQARHGPHGAKQVDRKTGAVLRPGKVHKKCARVVDRAGVELRARASRITALLQRSPKSCRTRRQHSHPHTHPRRRRHGRATNRSLQGLIFPVPGAVMRGALKLPLQKRRLRPQPLRRIRF